MKLAEAMRALQAVPAGTPSLDVALLCGFTPLHLQTFLAARLQQRQGTARRVALQTGLYGDLAGNLARFVSSGAALAIVVVEWSDLDPRLGLRQLSGWRPADLADIVAGVEAQAQRLQGLIEQTARAGPVVVAGPTLPLPPFAHTSGEQLDRYSAALRSIVASWSADLAGLAGVKVVHPQRLDQVSPLAQRLDVGAELTSGFPYSLAHADALAERLALLAHPPAPRKGLITDLDDTVWRGILGEVGPAGVSFDLDHRSQIHGLYQQLLRSLADAGVLVAVASKNEPALVAEALDRAELRPLRERLFPIEASWGLKSEAVGRVLAAWNIGPDSVVFVDDSPMELAEVQAAYPEVECLQFPRNNDAAAYELLVRLRDLFGKPTLTADDAIRRESLRRDDRAAPAAGQSADDFLAQAEAELTVQFVEGPGPPPPRALELVNKTNQFNLNGQRLTDAEWLAQLRRPGAFLMMVGYQDKFGPLGTIAVVRGRHEAETLYVENWVMSCRAFSRRIEHACLHTLFDRFSAQKLALAFEPTPRNGPLREFFTALLGSEPSSAFEVTQAAFREWCPPLHHTITIEPAP